METNNSTEIREHIRNESSKYKKLMKIYLIGYKNKSCPNTLFIVIYYSYYINYYYYFNFVFII